MVVAGRVRKGAYFDSVTLMTVGKELAGMAGVADAAVVMGTRENRAILDASGLLLPEFESTSGTDLLIAVKAETDDAAEAALAALDTHLADARKGTRTTEEALPASIDSALDVVPGANLALISVAGRYAAREARKALDAGLHVMLFSDNVSVEDELELKLLAHERDLLVMGPDCGTAILNGVPLAFANVVNRGDIGIVAASGTGLQEVSSLISDEGCGISQAIGTGGRDVWREVGGITFIDGLTALADDPRTNVIVLVSKPPDEEVLDAIRGVVAGIPKPVVSVFLGAPPDTLPGPDGSDRWMAGTLDEAAFAAVAISNGRGATGVSALLDRLERSAHEAMHREIFKREPGQRYLRGLMSGGTFATEAQIVLQGRDIEIHSNVPIEGARRLADPLRSVGNTIVDLGADEFTVGRPHPMIDYSIRKRRIAEEAQDPEVAVILLDVVLGYGSNPDPAGELCEVVDQATDRVAVVCSVTGTHRDPQDRRAVERALGEAGATVMPTNARAAKTAGLMAPAIGEH